MHVNEEGMWSCGFRLMEMQNWLTHMMVVAAVGWCWHSICSGEVNRGELLVHNFIHLHMYKIMPKTSRIFICGGMMLPVKTLQTILYVLRGNQRRKSSLRSSTDVWLQYGSCCMLWYRDMDCLPADRFLSGGGGWFSFCVQLVLLSEYIYIQMIILSGFKVTVFLKAIWPRWHPCGPNSITLMHQCGFHF